MKYNFLKIFLLILVVLNSNGLKVNPVEKTGRLEKIVTSHPTSVKSRYITGQDTNLSLVNKVIGDSFTQNKADESHKIDLSKLVVPEIRRTTTTMNYLYNPFEIYGNNPHFGKPSNKLSYDILYPTKEKYYKDRSITITDPKYEEYSKELINKFKSSLQKALRDINNQNENPLPPTQQQAQQMLIQSANQQMNKLSQ